MGTTGNKVVNLSWLFTCSNSSVCPMSAWVALSDTEHVIKAKASEHFCRASQVLRAKHAAYIC